MVDEKALDKIIKNHWYENNEKYSELRIEDKQYYIGWLIDENTRIEVSKYHWETVWKYEYLYTNVETFESYLQHGKFSLDGNNHFIKTYFSDIDTITDDKILELLKKYPNKYSDIRRFIDFQYHYNTQNLNNFSSTYNIIYKFPKAHEYCELKDKQIYEDKKCHEEYIRTETEKLNNDFRQHLKEFIKQRKKLGNPVEMHSRVAMNSMPGVTVMHGDDDRWIIIKM